MTDHAGGSGRGSRSGPRESRRPRAAVSALPRSSLWAAGWSRRCVCVRSRPASQQLAWIEASRPSLWNAGCPIAACGMAVAALCGGG